MHLLQGDDGEHGVLHDFGGDGPPLLLTHGNGLNAAMWTTALPVLQRHRHCFGLDFRGHGASRTQIPPLDVERSHLVTEILLAVAVIDEGPIDAVGHSLGGATLVRTELENPGTFRRMWLFEPVMVPEELLFTVLLLIFLNYYYSGTEQQVIDICTSLNNYVNANCQNVGQIAHLKVTLKEYIIQKEFWL